VTEAELLSSDLGDAWLVLGSPSARHLLVVMFLPAPLALLMLALHVLVAAGVVWSVRQVSPERRDGLWVAGLWLLPLLGALLLGPVWPIEHLIRFHEGFSLEALDAVTVPTADQHPAFEELVHGLSWGRMPRFRTLVGLSLGSTAAYVLALLLLVRRMRMGWMGAALVAGTVLSPSLRHAAVAETSGAWTSLWLVAAVPPMLWMGMAKDRREVVGAGLACGGVAAVIGLARPELGAVVLVGGFLRLASRSLQDLEAWWSARVTPERVGAGCLLAAILLGAVYVGKVHLGTLRVEGDFYWLVRALHPFNPTWLLTPLYLVSLSGVGVVMLAICGWGTAVRRPLSTGALVGVPWLWACYQAAAHGWPETSGFSAYEMSRYHAPIGALTILLALVGWRSLQARPMVRRTLLWLCLVPPLPVAGMMGAWTDAQGETGALPLWGWTDRDPTYALRKMLVRAEAFPDCTILARGAGWGRAHRWGWRALVGERSVLLVRGVQEPLTPGQALQALAPDAYCVAVWVGPDSYAEELEAPDLTGLRPMEVVQRIPRPATHPEHGLTWTSEAVDVGWYAMEGVPFVP
jgi:hypothetical protein